MRIDQRIPDLSDKELGQLHANAARLAQSGKPAQREQAESLLPLLGAEMERREAARVLDRPTQRRASAKRVAAKNAKTEDNP